MLLRFRVSNFRSFRTEQELSLTAAPLGDRTETVCHPVGSSEGVLPVAAIYGANASGKTNILIAMQFMMRAVKNSHARWPPDEPIKLDFFAGQAKAPSTFSVDFLLDGVRYQYGFSVKPEAVLSEWMYAYPSGKRQRWFSREKDKPIYFSTKLLGDNRAIARLTRPNSLFLSAAAQNNHEALSPIYQWFSSSLSFVIAKRDTASFTAKALHSDPKMRQRLARSLSLADMGIIDLVVRNLEVPAAAKEFADKLALLINTQIKSEQPLTFDEAPIQVQFLHKIGDKTRPFDESQESKGTIAFLCLLEPVSQALAKGGIVFLDELDESLHPLLAIEVIRQFSDLGINHRFAQLIFNTHDTNLLSSGLLRRDQIWFTEKERDGSSQLYPLTDFKPRLNENLENGYLQGRYGAIPFLNSKGFFEAEDERR